MLSVAVAQHPLFVAVLLPLLAVVLLFWVVHEPRRLGIGACFAFGIALDVHQGALLGQHALAYTLLSYLAITVHRRVLWFSLPAQALHHQVRAEAVDHQRLSRRHPAAQRQQAVGVVGIERVEFDREHVQRLPHVFYSCWF